MTKNKSLHKIQGVLILAILFCLPFYFVRFRFGWVSFSLNEVLILILLAVWIWEGSSISVVIKKWKKYWMPTELVLMGVLISILAGKNYYSGSGVLKGWFIIPIIFAVITEDFLEKEKNFFRKMLFAILAAGIFVSGEGIYYLFHEMLTYDGRLRIFFDSPNQLAMFLAPAFLIGIAGIAEGILKDENLKNEKASWQKIFLTGVVFLVGFNLYLTKSMGAWLAVGAVLSAYLWIKRGKVINRRRFLVFAAILVVLMTWVAIGKYQAIRDLGDRSSLASRIIIWKSSLLMAEKNPVFGIGPGNFEKNYLDYQKYFPPYLEWAVPQPHNIFLAFWLEAGLPGLIGFIWMLWLFFKDNKKARRNNFGAAVTCFLLMLYFILHGLVDTTYWRNDMAILFWFAVAANSFLSRPQSKERQQDLMLEA